MTNDVASAITDVKGGKIAFKVDKVGIIHASIGRVSFTPEKIAENSQELLNAVIKAKPSSAKRHLRQGNQHGQLHEPGHRDRYQGIRSLIRWMYQKNSVNSGSVRQKRNKKTKDQKNGIDRGVLKGNSLSTTTSMLPILNR